MTLFDLSNANASSSLTFKQAADYAFRMASRWGGQFTIFADSNYVGHTVLGGGAETSESPRADGMLMLGHASSLALGDLDWEWADGRNQPPPPSPFDDLPRPQPAQLVGHLAPETRVLMVWMSHLLAIQQAFHRNAVSEAGRLLKQEPTPVPLTRRVPHGTYLRMMEAKNCVPLETARIQTAVAAASNAFDMYTHGRDSEDIVFGRKEPHVEAAATATPGFR